jgi:hypothetical protein
VLRNFDVMLPLDEFTVTVVPEGGEQV